LTTGPMEGFWGILKCEMYYLNHFVTYEELVAAVEQFIHYYNYQRRQHKLNCLPRLFSIKKSYLVQSQSTLKLAYSNNRLDILINTPFVCAVNSMLPIMVLQYVSSRFSYVGFNSYDFMSSAPFSFCRNTKYIHIIFIISQENY